MNKIYKNSRLKNCVKKIGNLLQSEISLNSTTKEYLESLKDELRGKINDDIQLKKVEETTTKFLEIDNTSSEMVTYMNEYFLKIEQLTLFKNYLLLIYFIDDLKKTQNKISLRSHLNNLINKGNWEKDRYIDLSMIQKKYDEFLESFIYTLDEKLINKESTNFNFENFLTYNVNYQNIQRDNEYDSDFKIATIKQFINNIIPLTDISLTNSIKVFFEVFETDYGTFTIPESLSSFLRYYIYNDKYNRRNTVNSVYLSGVGSTYTLSKIIADSKTKSHDGFGRKLNIGTSDNNIISRQIRLIHYRIITKDFSNVISIENRNILENTDKKYDIVISIPPTKLDSITTNKLIPKDTLFGDVEEIDRYKDYTPLPYNNLSSLIYFYDSMKLFNNKVFIVVPLSFINTNQYLDIKVDEKLEDGIEIDRNKITDTYLHARLIKQIIKNRAIKKIMLLPKGTVTHTNQQCVLIECSKNENKGIYFIDTTKKFTQTIEGQVILDNAKYKKKLKDVFDFEGDSCYVDKESAMVESTSTKEKFLVNKFISYDDIDKHKDNLSPMYYLNEIDEVTIVDTDRNKLSELESYFDIFKLQNINIEEKGKNTIELKFFSKSDFSEYGITESSAIKNSMRSIVNLKSKKYINFNKVYDGDILIFVNYKNKNDITYVSISPKDKAEYLGKHNLIVLRLKKKKNEKDKNVCISKSVFMYFMSKRGEEKLKSLTVTTTANKPLLTIDSLKLLKVDFSPISVTENCDKFNLANSQIQKINKNIKNLETLFS